MFASEKRDQAKRVAQEKPGAGASARHGEGALEQNLTWQSLALRPPVMQPKLTIGQPDDPFEREADQVADRVMGMESSPSSGTGLSFSAQNSLTAQRKCAPCDKEEEETLRRKEQGASAGATVGAVAAAPLAHPALSSAGQPLDPSTRGFMESRMGGDFSRVRAHTDARAAASASALRAAAYTVGSDIVFGAGMYQPQSHDGRRLLAHELAHVRQQDAAGLRLQRNNDDFKVTQVQPDPVESTEGMADRFFFEFDQSDLRASVPEEAAERTRLEAWATAHAGQQVELVGRASQEGSQAHNSDLARQRAATVSAILTAGGVTVTGTPKIDMTFAQRPVDYRFYRSVEIIVASGAGGTTGTTCSAFTPAQQAQDVTDCESAFTAAHGRAVDIVNAAMDRIRPTTDPETKATPTRDTVLNDRFPGVARSTLLPLFESVATRLGEIGLSTGHVCNHRCAPGCERAASAGPGGPMSICSPFYIPGLAVDLRVFAVLHENTHSAVDPGSPAATPRSVGIDFSYSNTRLFSALEGSEAQGNADSYVMTLLVLAQTAGNAPAVLTARGIAPADTMLLTTPAGEAGDRNRTARRAIGFAGSWLNYASFWSPDLYDFVAASLSAWSTPELGGIGHILLELFAPQFQLRHPGTSALDATHRPGVDAFQTALAGRGFATPAISSHANVQDRTRVAGIYDRFTRMHERLSDPLVVDQAASGSGSWAAGTGLPGLGTNVSLHDAFFTSLSPAEQTRHVIRLMAQAMTDVGATWVEAYVEGADGVRQFRGLGP